MRTNTSPSPGTPRLLTLLGALTVACVTLATPARAEVPPLKAGAVFPAKDTLEIGQEAKPDAAACLEGLKWAPQRFDVKLETPDAYLGDWLVRFPTPFPSQDAANDIVAMEWRLAKGADGQPITAPAVVVVHESGRGMVAGRFIGAGLREKGFHTFMLHLPGYGARTSDFTKDVKKMLPALQQAVGDVRRARDAVAALPFVDKASISLEGTSLGGFVVATVAGLDAGYQKCFVLLAGGQLSNVLLHGQRDAATMRKQLEDAGVTAEQITALCARVEPMRLAHRIDKSRLWLFSANEDEVVPRTCTDAFAEAVGLDAVHHQRLSAGHYTAALHIPVVIQQMTNALQGRPIDEGLPAPVSLPASE